MKNRILLFLLLISSYSFGQSVPNTESFSLQDVYNAVDNHTPATTEDLQSCFTNAIAGYYNATYNQDSYAPANSMLRFRDYKPTGCSAPTVTTASITSIAGISAISGGNVTSDGGCTVTARGVCWNISTSPTVSNSHTIDGSGTGSFTSSITGLTCGTTYYVRSYATNSQGTSYGSNETFTAIDPHVTNNLKVASTATCSGTPYDFTPMADYSTATSDAALWNGATCSSKTQTSLDYGSYTVNSYIYFTGGNCIFRNNAGYYMIVNQSSFLIESIFSIDSDGKITSINAYP